MTGQIQRTSPVHTVSEGVISPKDAAAGFGFFNNIWSKAKNYAGSAWVNLFRLNTSDEIEVSATLKTGALEITEDAGAVTLVDFPVSATPAAGVEESYTFKIDGNNILKIYAESKSDGDIQNISIRSFAPSIIDQSPQTLTGAGAVDITSAITHLVTTAADALTIADGIEGQRKYIIMKTDGGDGTLTPANYANGTTITFDAEGDTVELLFTNGAWHWIGGKATSA